MLKIKEGKITRPLKAVFYGPEGVGKSTLAAQCPEPLFIDTEGGTDQLEVRRVGPPENWNELISTINEVARDPDVCRTLVIDTIDWAEQLAVRHVCIKNVVNSIEAIPYGKGYVYVADEMGRLLAACDAVIASGKNVVILAHAKMRKQELPDEAGSFNRWELKLSRHAAPLVKEWSDLLLFLNFQTYVVTTDSGSHKAQGGRRVMFTSHHPCWDGKNRAGLPERIDMDYGAIAPLFAGGKAESRPIDVLRARMADAGVTDGQLQAVVAARTQKYDADVPVADYDPAFIRDWCVPHFDKIVNMIREENDNG